MKTSSKFMNLGNEGLQVSKLGLGCMGMSEFYGATNDIESMKTIQTAYDLGINHFDTSDSYGIGHNELLLGKAIQKFNRDSIVIATKCGFERHKEDPSFLAINNSPEYIKKCCNDSLKRLNIDYIDLFYLHRVNHDTPIEVSMQALSDLVQEGKILNIGLSEVNAKTIIKANSIHKLTAIQSEYSIWSREPENEIIPLCKDLGIGFVAFSPLGNGFLSGKISNVAGLNNNDLRREYPRFQENNISHNLLIITILKEIAKRKGCTAAQIALAWILAQSDNITAIPGTKRISYLKENIGALDVKLSVEDLKELDRKIPMNFAQGYRMPEEYVQFANK